MITLKSKINLTEEVLALMKRAKNDILIFSPYVNTSALKKLTENIFEKIKITIVTTWKPADLIMGYSDLNVYPFCKNKNYTLLLNNKIHLKSIIIDNMHSSYIGSANITNAGLAFNENYNYELGVINEDLSLDNKIYFDKIILDSTPVDETLFSHISSKIEKMNKPKFELDFDINFSDKKDFLFSSLPMSEDVHSLYEICNSQDTNKYSDNEIRSAEHDRMLYQIPKNLTKEKFNSVLTAHFLNHPFIISYLDFIGEGKFFGETTKWLHDKISSVPCPRRFDVKKAQNRINNFILHLSSEYNVEIPGEKSERFFKV